MSANDSLVNFGKSSTFIVSRRAQPFFDDVIIGLIRRDDYDCDDYFDDDAAAWNTIPSSSARSIVVIDALCSLVELLSVGSYHVSASLLVSLRVLHQGSGLMDANHAGDSR